VELIPLKLFSVLVIKVIPNRRDSSPQLRPISVFVMALTVYLQSRPYPFCAVRISLLPTGYVIFLLFYFHEK